jgi:Rrf2 family protein
MLYHLAQNYQKGPLQLSEIAQREDISEKYLGQIVLLLRSGGLLASVRGNQGGYLLPRPPEAITVLQVVGCLEGDFLGFPDGLVDGAGAAEGLVVTNEVWRRLRMTVEATLGEISLRDLASFASHGEVFLNYVI